MMIRHRLLRHASVAATAAALAVSTAAYGQPEAPQSYQLPTQDLGEALREVAARSGRNLIVPSALVAGRRSPPLSGRYTPHEAIEALLAGSGLTVRTTSGNFVIVPLGSAENQSGASDPADDETIIVTGTNIRGAQPTSPVIALGRRDIDASGSNSVERLMAQLPQNALNGVNRENFRAAGAGADPTEHGSGLNLRGLGQRATLVLLNGRRMAPSGTGSFVDISLIPLSAIDRVEILTDGASAIYGSDAVSGVVNFILRDDFQGLETLFSAGTATKGDGDVLQGGVTGGTAWSTGSAMLSYEYRAEDEILARDRDFTINLAPDTALLPRERRHSIFGTVRQDLGDRLRFEGTGIFADRLTERSYFFAGSPIPVDQDAEARTRSLSASLRAELGGGWGADLGGGYSLSTTDQQQVQSAGQGLVSERSSRNAIADVSLKADGSLAELPGGALRVAVGLEGRREDYRDRFRTRSSFVPTDIGRSVRAAFVEAQIPVFSAANRRTGLERLLVTAAGRFEDYEDYGSTFDPKFGLLWSPLPGVSLRSSYSTSFRAPLLSEAAGTYSAIYFPAELLFIDPSQGRGVGLVLGGFDPDVRPERSRSWTVGVEVAPLSGLSAELNYYDIRFNNRIALPSPLVTVVGDPGFDTIVTRGPDEPLVRALIAGASLVRDSSGPNFSNGGATPSEVTVIVDNRISNTASTTTSGLDANLRYRFQIGANDFSLAANANYILAFEDRLRPGSPIIDALDTPYRPLDLRLRGQLGWNRRGWSANLFVTHADGYRDTRRTPAIPIDSYTTVDLGLAHEWGEATGPEWLRGTRIAFHAENLLDSEPPRLLPDLGASAGLGYDPVNATARGRFVSLQLRKLW